MDRGVLQATDRGAAKTQTRLKHLSTHGAGSLSACAVFPLVPALPDLFPGALSDLPTLCSLCVYHVAKATLGPGVTLAI